MTCLRRLATETINVRVAVFSASNPIKVRFESALHFVLLNLFGIHFRLDQSHISDSDSLAASTAQLR